MKLPQADSLIVEEKKLTEYLLDLAHEQGGAKAKFFQGRTAPLGWRESAPSPAMPDDFRFDVFLSYSSKDKPGACLKKAFGTL